MVLRRRSPTCRDLSLSSGVLPPRPRLSRRAADGTGTESKGSTVPLPTKRYVHPSTKVEGSTRKVTPRTVTISKSVWDNAIFPVENNME